MFLHRTTGLRAFLLALALGPTNAAPRGHEHFPAISPPPQQISSSGPGVSLNCAVTIVTGNATDTATLNTVKEVVSSAGGNANLSPHPTDHGTQIFVGTEAENPDAAITAKSITGKSANGLTAEGYVLATGHHGRQRNIVLNGADTRGTFYASQTLRQLVDGHHVPGVKVRDWPLMSIRGSIEGFYGPPWSHQARLDQFVFYGKHKMNTYIYTPKDDDLLRAKWRKLYSGDAIDELKDLIKTANENHVDFTYALSPGLDICYSSEDDFNATITKFNQVRGFGAHSFYIALDDIPLKFHCESDKQKWNASDYRWFADAQAYYLNRIQKEYIEPNGFKDLETVPTNYAGSEPDPYKNELGTKLNDKISIQWTGEGVFSDKVTVKSVKQALKTYVTEKMFLWDNFPVNDGMLYRLFLNPLTGRATDLYKYLTGFTSNPMIQPYASMPALANYGDYTWNAPSYNADKSMDAVLWELAGSEKRVHEAVVAFADLNQNWPYRKPVVNSPQLNKDLAAFWTARNSTSTSDNRTQPLRNRLALLTTLPDVLPQMAMKGFATDVAPWSTLAMKWAHACQHLVGTLDALDAGNMNKADKEFKAAKEWVEKTKAKTVEDRDGTPIAPVVGKEAFNSFLNATAAIYKSQ